MGGWAAFRSSHYSYPCRGKVPVQSRYRPPSYPDTNTPCSCIVCVAVCARVGLAQATELIQRIGVKEKRGGDTKPVWHLRPEFMGLLSADGPPSEYFMLWAMTTWFSWGIVSRGGAGWQWGAGLW
jgi:hypothetical protein